MMTRSDLKKYSQEHHIPFAQALGWYVAGLVLYFTEKTGFNRNLIVKSPDSIDPDYDVHILEEGIRFYYIEDEGVDRKAGFVPGSAYSRDFTAKLLLQIQKEAVKENCPLIIKIGTGNRVEFSYDGMYVPLEVKTEPVPDSVREKQTDEEKFEPEETEYGFFDPEIQSISVRVLPGEYKAAGYICEIMEKLELINDMDVYLYLYRLISEKKFAARDVCNAIEAQSKKQLDWHSFEIFRGYQKNTYMKKKWKVILRRHRIKEPGWQETMELLVRFIEPLWAALTKGELFFGDWMPELGRYLE
ncbi:MAG: hypothetical protein ACI4CS_02690 [Candidatus Weimeria sp.]